jgi:hypothetical protein
MKDCIDRLDRVPPKRWGGKRVAVYGNTQRERCVYLYDAITLQKNYRDDSTMVRVRVCTDSPFAQAERGVRANRCVILEEMDDG